VAETLLRPQEPAAPQEPSLGSRAWSYWTERYLTLAEPDERIQKLARAAARDKVLNGEESAMGKLAVYPEEMRTAALRHIQHFDAKYQEAQTYPLRATSIFQEGGSDRRLFEIASKPGGLEILKDLGTQADDGNLYRIAEDAVNMANLARVGQVMMAGETTDPDAAAFPALAKGGAEWGESLKQPTPAETRYGMMAPGAGMALLSNRQAVNAEYQNFAFAFSEGLARGAARMGVDYQAPKEAPKNIEEAKRLFLDALPAAEQVQTAMVGAESRGLGLYGPDDARRAMASYAKVLFAVQQEMPEKAGGMAEIQAVLNAYAAGETPESNPVADIAIATIKPAFWVLEKIGRVDQATNALLYGTVGTTAPVRFKFADGTTFTDILDAAEYSQKIQEQGGEYRSPQWLLDQSASSRFRAMEEEMLAAEMPLPGQREAGLFATAGRGMQRMTYGAQEGLRRAGDAIFGGEAPIEDGMAARPVVEYGVTALPEGGSTVDFAEIGSALWNGDGKFIGDTIRENTSTKSDQDTGYRVAGWVTAEAQTILLSPWNIAGTGQVTARGVNAAKARLLDEAPIPTDIGGSAPRVYRFTDGRQMNEDWAALREVVGEKLGAGSKADMGGSGDIADTLLTAVRDAPGQSYDEVVTSLKNRPGFLDEMGFHAENSGLAPWVQARTAGAAPGEYLAMRNKAVAEALDDGLAKVGAVIEQAPHTFGYKDFWESPASRAWKMEARRGIYFGPVGVPLGPMGRWAMEGARRATTYAKQSKAVAATLRPFSALKQAGLGIFHGSHVATQTPAMGTAGVIQNVERIPYQMRKAFERQYRLQAATLDARSQMSTFDLLAMGGDALPSEVNRKLITILAESGDDLVSQARALVDNAEVYGSAVGWTPTGATQAERMASALAKARELNPITTRVQQFLDATFEGLTQAGVLDSTDYVKNYVTHFYHGPAGAKAIRSADDIAGDISRRRVQSVENVAQLRRGTTAIRRVGPESVIEAIQLGGYTPELDIAKLTHYRTTQALKAELDAAFMARISRTFGTPMLRGKEAAVRLTQAVRGTNRWQAETGYASAVVGRREYAKDLQEVSRLIRDRAAQMERQALTELGSELGIPTSKFLDERMLVGAMMESEDFLRRAASGRKGSLDKMMTPEARKGLREISREMLALRKDLRIAANALKDLGVEIPMLAELSDVQLASLARRAAESTMQRGGAIPARARDVRVAKSALAGTVAESKAIGQRLKQLAGQQQELVAERVKIGKAWDKAKADAVGAGLNADDLAQAKTVDQVRKTGDGLNQAEAFAAYKSAQADYVANAQARKQIESRMLYERGQANRARSYADKARKRVEELEASLKQATQRAKAIAKERRAAGRLAADLEGDLAKTVDGFVATSRAYLEARRAANALLASGKAHGVALALRGAAKRVAAHGAMVKSATAAFEAKHGVSALAVRQRALTPRTVGGAESALQRAEKAALRPGPADTAAVPPVSPARDAGELSEYHRAQEALDALEMSRSEQSALLYEVFGARTLTEVPIHELRMLTDSSAPMRASIIRFIADPTGGMGRKAARRMTLGKDTPADRIGRALGVSMTGPGDEVAENIERALDRVIADAGKGSERAQRVLGAIAPADLAALYAYEDLGRATRMALEQDPDIRKWAATMSGKARGSLERQLRTTFIPLELGLAMKTLMGEGVFKAGDAAKVALATRFGEAFARMLYPFTAVTRGFKTAAIGYRASLLPGRRNSLFDGARSMIQLGAWGFFSLSVRKAFRADMESPMGSIVTASGIVDRSTFHRIWEERGSAMFGAMADSLDDISRTVENAARQAKNKRFASELEAVGREGSRTKGVNIPRGAAASAGAGGALAEALTNDLASGAALGFGFYGFLAGATGLRRVVHSSGQLATKSEWLLPIGPNAMERLDNTFRKYIYWSYVKSGMAPADAMDLMLRRMRDMTNLTPAERKIVQHLASAAPFMFYNFTKQNGIAQLVRFLDNPAPTVAMLRTIRDLSDSYAQDEETRAFWQNITDTIVKGGAAWNLQDESTAALDLLAPVTGLLEGATQGRPLSGMMEGLRAMGTAGQSAPIWQYLMGEAKPVTLPLPLAQKILDQHGPFHDKGVRAYINEQGVPRVELEGALGVIASLTGATVALNDVGRLQLQGAKGEWNRVILEALGMGRIYDQLSEMELEMERFNDAERRGMEAADFLEANGISGDTALDAIGLTPEEKAVIQEVLRYQNGQYIAKQIGELKARFRALQGKGRTALAGRNPERN
jgi:hypothetical protein